MKNISQFLDSDQMLFFGFTNYWCVMCKFNKTVGLDIIRVINLFQRKKNLKCEVTLLSNMMKYKNY